MQRRRAVSLMLAIFAFVIFCCGPLCHNAEAIVGVDDAIIAVIIAALAAIGITFITTGAYQSNQEYVSSLMQQYATENNTTPANQLRGSQTAVNSYGKILVNSRFVGYIEGFAAWLKVTLGLTDNTVTTLQAQGSYLGGLTAYKLPVSLTAYNFSAHGKKEELEASSPGDNVYVIFGGSNSTSRVVYFSPDPHSVVYEYSVWWDSITNTPDITTTQHILTRDNKSFGWGDNELAVVDSNFYTAVSGEFSYTHQPTPEWSTGTAPIRYPFADITNALKNADLVNNEGITIGTGIITLPSDDPDYIDGKGAIIDVGADWGATLPDITDEEIPDAFSEDKVGDATIEYEDEDVVEEQIDDELTNSVSSNVEDYTVTGLEQVFPFCIPFDLYNFVAALDATPEAPSFTWRFYVPGICDEEIEIDLAPFDTVAALLRTMELLLFCVGLAFVTRKIIRG